MPTYRLGENHSVTISVSGSSRGRHTVTGTLYDKAGKSIGKTVEAEGKSLAKAIEKAKREAWRALPSTG